MFEDVKASFPNEIINDMSFEKNIFNTASNDVMISTFSEWNGSSYVLRIYQLLYNRFNETYEFAQELAAFSFEERSELVDFLNRLPELNGIEMLMLLNPVSPGQSLMH